VVDLYAGISTKPKEMGAPRRRFVRQGLPIALKIAASRRETPLGSFLYHHRSAALLSRLRSQSGGTILRLQGGRAPGAMPSGALRHCCSSLLHSHRRRQRHGGCRNQSSPSSSRTIRPLRRSCWESGGSPVSSTASCSRCASASSRTASERRSAASRCRRATGSPARTRRCCRLGITSATARARARRR